MTRSKQESTATIKLVNLVMKRDSVFMAFSSGRGPVQTPFWCGNAFLVTPLWLRLCRVGTGPVITSRFAFGILSVLSNGVEHQEDGMDVYAPEIERVMTRLFSSLGEKDRRRYAAVEATKLGH